MAMALRPRPSPRQSARSRARRRWPAAPDRDGLWTPGRRFPGRFQPAAGSAKGSMDTCAGMAGLAGRVRGRPRPRTISPPAFSSPLAVVKRRTPVAVRCDAATEARRRDLLSFLFGQDAAHAGQERSVPDRRQHQHLGRLSDMAGLVEVSGCGCPLGGRSRSCRLQPVATDTRMASDGQRSERAAPTGPRMAVVGAGARRAGPVPIDWRRRATTSSPSMRAPRRLPEGVRYRYRTVDSGARGRMALGIGGITVGAIGAREMDLTFDGPLSGCDGSSSGSGSPAVNAPGIEDAMENVPDAVDVIAELRQAEKPSTQARGRHETWHDGGGRRRAVEVPHRRGRDDGLPAEARADEHLGLRAGSRRLEGRTDHHRRQAREGHGRRCGPRGGVAYSEQVPVHLLDSALERSSPAQ